MSRPRLLDLCCCQGGASWGYHYAGFDVTGVDVDPQPRYPFEFIQADALEVLRDRAFVSQFDAVHASFPCQAHTLCQRIQNNDHPDLIGPGRPLLQATGLPWVMENVPGSPMVDPIELCGAMFGLETYRHRLFESNLDLVAPAHPEHVARTTKMGRTPVEGEFMHIVGNFSGVDRGREVMGMPWATRDGLREAIPPAYAEWIGSQLIAHLEQVAA
jgi:DNA (cytosine-5)-methyltransferase 1